MEGSQGSQDSQYSERGPAEESMVEGVEEEVVAPNLHQQLAAFIRARPSLHQQVVVYEPLWLHQFHQDVKEAGVRCSLAQVQDYLDLHCICFRTETNRAKGRAKKSPRKKKSPVKKKTPKKKSPKKKKSSSVSGGAGAGAGAGPSGPVLARTKATAGTRAKPKAKGFISP